MSDIEYITDGNYVESLLDDKHDRIRLDTMFDILTRYRPDRYPEYKNVILDPPTYQELKDIIGYRYLGDEGVSRFHAVIVLAVKAYNNIGHEEHKHQ